MNYPAARRRRPTRRPSSTAPPAIAGRDPREIRRIYNIPGAFAPAAPAPARDTDQTIVGPPDRWVEVLTHLALDIGFDTFMLAAEPDPDTLRTFVEDGRPAGSRARRRGPKVTSSEAKPETERGRAMFQELLWVHAAIRRDLELVEKLAADVGRRPARRGGRKRPGRAQDDRAVVAAEGELPALLRFVHAHHGAEDALLFPALRAADPSIEPVVDRLEADHSRSPTSSTRSRTAARALSDTDGGDARRRVIDGLRDLHVHLLEHLDYEERSAGPAMRRLETLALP